MSETHMTSVVNLTTKWRIGVIHCQTLAISYQTLDNPNLLSQQALAVVDRWNALDKGRRLNWLVGRFEVSTGREVG
jgi:hypothetical protein